MTYGLIDPVISSWASHHTLHVHRRYRDDEVRSVEIVGVNGRRCQIWIDPPDSTGMVGVHVWDYKKRRSDHLVAQGAALAACLENAYATAQTWVI